MYNRITTQLWALLTSLGLLGKSIGKHFFEKQLRNLVNEANKESFKFLAKM